MLQTVLILKCTTIRDVLTTFLYQSFLAYPFMYKWTFACILQECNDLDLIFRLDRPSDTSNRTKGRDVDVNGYDLDQIKHSALMALQEFLGPEVNRERLGPTALAEAYIQKMVKIDTTRVNSHSGDKWSLMSLDNIAGRSVEMKFVVSMRRQYEFSIDSFQVGTNLSINTI